ncbi:hypothetical protein [Rhodoplanes sp. Z2-YC6860]|uniref:hypothetical protein n=1 Tax=Rhodoplanes sp. Z2-YC6860 TaxID=674703 RepID=UPI0012ECCDAD|nr:hypothetical protein [Rhodoplanes sp. Z2-YC6860]
MKEALEEIAELPEAAQDKIGEELLLHVDKLRRLQAKIKKGLLALDAGQAVEVDLEMVIRRARAQHGIS